MFIDTHCHLDIISKDIKNIQEILKIANENQIKFIFNISVNIRDFFKFVEMLKDFKSLYFSFGISPNDIPENFKIKPLTINELNSFFNKGKIITDKIIAIGEIGLDYYHLFSSKKVQRDTFEVQLELAKLHNLPVIIHTRDAFNDTFDILKGFKNNIIFHCYSGGIKETEYILENFDNAFFSFAGNITYKKAIKLQESLKIIPLERFFLETDSPYLSPVPFRGKKNYPYRIVITYKFVSRLLNIDLDQLEKIVLNNVNKAFNLQLS